MESKELILFSPFTHAVKSLVDELVDSDDELDREVDIILQRFVTVPRIAVCNFFEEVVPAYSDDEFIRCFRLSRDVFNDLVEQYYNCALYQNIASQHLVIPADKSLAVFLWFCTHEAVNYRDLSNLFNISPSTVFAIIRRTICFVSSLSAHVITWPTTDGMRHESEYHLKKYGIPGIVGAVDCTHIRVDPPKNSKDDYVDQKGNITMIVQAVCNHQNKFLHVSVGFPGSIHDSRAFRCSSLPDQLKRIPDGYRILGDSAYPCLRPLMTPYQDDGGLTAAQKQFNYQLNSSRVMIERSFGILKQKFRQLHYCKLRGHQTLCHFIRACFVLHNLGKSSDLKALNIDRFTKDPSVSSYPEIPYRENNDSSNEGHVLRDSICATYFK